MKNNYVLKDSCTDEITGVFVTSANILEMMNAIYKMREELEDGYDENDLMEYLPEGEFGDVDRYWGVIEW